MHHQSPRPRYARWHRWVRIPAVEDHLRLGWMPETTFLGTTHGQYSVHLTWPCETCYPRLPVAESERPAP